MIITERMLYDERACLPQYLLFMNTFPQGVTVTEEICIEHADKFDWLWAVYKLIGTAAACKKFFELTDPAVRVYLSRCNHYQLQYDRGPKTATRAEEFELKVGKELHKVNVERARAFALVALENTNVAS